MLYISEARFLAITFNQTVISSAHYTFTAPVCKRINPVLGMRAL